jgi:hypothetical protein
MSEESVVRNTSSVGLTGGYGESNTIFCFVGEAIALLAGRRSRGEVFLTNHLGSPTVTLAFF